MGSQAVAHGLFGTSVALDAAGNVADVGAPDILYPPSQGKAKAGSVEVFTAP
jgi:hypothetical protein